MLPHPGWAFPPPFGRGMPMPGMFGAPPFGHHPFGPFVMDPRYTSSVSSVPPRIRLCRVLRRDGRAAVQCATWRREGHVAREGHGTGLPRRPARRVWRRRRTAAPLVLGRADADAVVARPHWTDRRADGAGESAHQGSPAEARACRPATQIDLRRARAATGEPMAHRRFLTARPMLFAFRTHAEG
jgi:ribosomal protein L36